MKNILLSLILVFAAAAAVAGQSYGVGTRLVTNDGGSLLGASSISGDTAVVGSYIDNNRHGAAYVFVRSGTGWVQQQKLIASDGAANEEFGTGVAISGDTIIVASDKPAAYIFVRSGDQWTEQQKLTLPSVSFHIYGNRVDISGDTAVIGSKSDDGNKGAAFVFVRSGTNWSLQQKLFDPQATSSMGNAVSISGDAIIVGAANSLAGGSIYIFERSGTVWTQKLKHTADWHYPDLGRYVSISGNRAVAAACYDTPGSVVYFRRSGSTWAFEVTTSGPGLYGQAAAIFGDTVVVTSALQIFNPPFSHWEGRAYAGFQQLTTTDGPAVSWSHVDITVDNMIVGNYIFRQQNQVGPVSFSGRVLSADGRGLPRGVVYVTDGNGIRHAAAVNHFGYFRLNGVNLGSSAVVSVSSKSYRYGTRTFNPGDSLTDVSFTPLP